MSDRLAELLATGERAAFHGRPGAGIAALASAVELAAAEGRTAEGLAARWLLGVTQSAAGFYGSALHSLAPLLDNAGHPVHDEPERRLFGALAAATSASVHRQLGRHGAARDLDTAGLALTDGTGEAAFDCVLGLASDAVGVGDDVTAEAELTRADELAEGQVRWWRQRVRAGWVRAEVMLLQSDPVAATDAAEASVALAETSGAPRHVAKGLLIAGIAHVQAERRSDALASLRRASALAESLGATPLVWPARALLGALVAGEDAVESLRCLDAAAVAVREIADGLPEPLRDEWLARDDVAAIVGDREYA
jgi:hypothetical protein